jgi:predicted metal-dependent phosphoesterase TrpH
VKSVQEAFNLYLGQGGKFYVDKETTSSRQAIEMIHAAGGVAVLAHPFQLRRENNAQLLTVIKSLADQGLDGIEVIHSDHRDSLIDHLTEVAGRMNLITTGGSDFHGASKPHIHLGRAGNRRIPRELYDNLLLRLQRRHDSHSPARTGDLRAPEPG